MGSEAPLAAARPQAQKAACGGNTSSLGGDEVLPIQIEPIAWYPGYSPLGEQSRHKHGNRPNLVVLLLGVSPLWGSRPTPPIKIALWAFKGQHASPTARPRNGGPGGRAPLSCTLCAMEGGALLASSCMRTLRGAALRHAPQEHTSHQPPNDCLLPRNSHRNSHRNSRRNSM